MKKILLLFYVLLLHFVCYAQKQVDPGSLKYLDYKRGFKEIILGDTILTINDYIIVAPDSMNTGPGTMVYEVTDPKFKTVGDNVKIERLYVHTFKGKISSVLAYMEKPNGENLKGILWQAYGRGRKPNQYIEKYYWFSKDVEMLLHLNGYKNDVMAMFDSKIRREMNDYQKSVDRKEIEDL